MITQKEKEAFVNLNLTKEERTKFKVRCSQNGYNMREALRLLVRQVNCGVLRLPEKED